MRFRSEYVSVGRDDLLSRKEREREWENNVLKRQIYHRAHTKSRKIVVCIVVEQHTTESCYFSTEKWTVH
jgi:hypothetical protein